MGFLVCRLAIIIYASSMSAVVLGGHRKAYCAVITLALQSRFKTSTEVFPVGGSREHQG